MDLPSLKQELKLSGNLPKDVAYFLEQNGHADTAKHCQCVAIQAEKLAHQFGVSEARAKTAGWLHDVSTVIPDEKRIQVALDYGVDVVPEERKLPMIVHQKLSALLARDFFGITEAGVLSAISCHTTLKKDASPLDKIVFVADKVAWDQEEQPPYLVELLSALEHSLDEAAFVYLDYLWQRRKTLPVLHPWVKEAHQQLASSRQQPRGAR